VEVISSILNVVPSAVAESELGALFINAQAAVPIRATLEELGYPQGPTTIFCDNTAAISIANKTSRRRRSKAMDMRFHWIQDRIAQGQFKIVWRPSADNLADFFTKTLPAKTFFSQRSQYVFTPTPAGWSPVSCRRNKRRVLPMPTRQ
jgi:hypothetical protein